MITLDFLCCISMFCTSVIMTVNLRIVGNRNGSSVCSAVLTTLTPISQNIDFSIHIFNIVLYCFHVLDLMKQAIVNQTQLYHTHNRDF